MSQFLTRKAIILTPYLMDGATIGTVGSESGSLPASNLQELDPRAKVWKIPTLSAASVTINLGELAEFDHVFLGGLTATMVPNLLTRSVELEHTDYTKENLTSITVDTSPEDPFGGIRARSILDTNDGGDTVHAVRQTRDGVFSAERNWVASVWLEADTLSEGGIWIQFGGASHSIQALFDLTSLSLVSTDETGNGQLLAGGIAETRGSWIRVWVAGSNSSDFSGLTAKVVTASGGSASYTGDGTGTIRAIGLQLEEGSSPSDYVETEDVGGALIRHRFAREESDLAGSPVVDTGMVSILTSNVDGQSYERGNHLFDLADVATTPVRLKWWRIDVDDENNPDGELLVGRAMIGEALEIQSYLPYGGSIPSFQTVIVSRDRTLGDSLVPRGHAAKRTLPVKFLFTSEDDLWKWEEIKRRSGSNGDLAVVVDPTGGNVHRSLFQGLLSKTSGPKMLGPSQWSDSVTFEEI